MSQPITGRLAVIASILSLAGCAGQPQTENPVTVQMDCGLQPITAVYTGDHATVMVGDVTLELAAAISASGAKYQQPDNDQTYLWGKGDTALLQIAGRAWPMCVRQGTLTDPFQARGNEPFWQVEVHRDQLTLRTPANSEPGPVTVRHQPMSDHGHRFTASVDGLDLVLDIQPDICHDTMTGMPYPYRAELVVNQALAQGCAGEPKRLLQGAEWTITSLNGEPVDAETSATIEFFSDGLVAGRAFCNRFTGKHQLTGERLRIGPLASTKMACGGSSMALENQLLQQLAQVNRFNISASGELLLYTNNERSITARLAIEQAGPAAE